MSDSSDSQLVRVCGGCGELIGNKPYVEALNSDWHPNCFRMPPRKKAYREEDVKEAVAKVKAKEISLRAASKLYSIPVMTLSDHVNGKRRRSKPGPQPVLSEEKEALFTRQLVDLADSGVELTSHLVRVKVAEFCTKASIRQPFKCGLAGVSWYRGYVRRHPELPVHRHSGRSQTTEDLTYNPQEASADRNHSSDEASDGFDEDAFPVQVQVHFSNTEETEGRDPSESLPETEVPKRQQPGAHTHTTGQGPGVKWKVPLAKKKKGEKRAVSKQKIENKEIQSKNSKESGMKEGEQAGAEMVLKCMCMICCREVDWVQCCKCKKVMHQSCVPTELREAMAGSGRETFECHLCLCWPNS